MNEIFAYTLPIFLNRGSRMKTQNNQPLQRHSFTHIVNTLVDRAKHEGTLMTFEGLLRRIEVDERDDG